MITDDLLLSVFKEILPGYKLPLAGIHGVPHWGRVLENGLRLAEQTGANTDIVKLFALLHDARRINDDLDREHGRRGADMARSLQGKLFMFAPAELALLCLACEGHTAGKVEADITVQTCWDADRLDLRRVGYIPDPRRLCTATAKEQGTIEWASRRSSSGYVTDFARLLLELGRHRDDPRNIRA